MYSITVSFAGPTSWAFLYKDKDKADAAYAIANKATVGAHPFEIADEFGQQAAFTSGAVSGVCMEDLDATEIARIQRSLGEERCKVKLMTAAQNDPLIKEAIRQQQMKPAVLTPGFSGRN